MVKEPQPGRVKTRLGRSIGMTSAAWWFRHQSQQLIRNVAYDPRWHSVLAVSPDLEGMSSRVWPKGIERIGQGRGDLGTRMRRLFETAPAGPCLIVGSDIPGISSGLIWQSFQALMGQDAMIGPAEDGGYWLIGLNRGSGPVPRALFDGVRWSGAHAMDDTISTLGTSRIGYSATMTDVDTQADLIALRQSRLGCGTDALQSD